MKDTFALFTLGFVCGVSVMYSLMTVFRFLHENREFRREQTQKARWYFGVIKEVTHKEESILVKFCDGRYDEIQKESELAKLDYKPGRLLIYRHNCRALQDFVEN